MAASILNADTDLDMKESDIRQFYRGRDILITGVSGFIGKVLLEKVMRSLPEIGTIYILLRPKKGLSFQERVHEIFKSRCFSFHTPSVDQKNKLVAVEGDVESPMFGLSTIDLDRMSRSVSVVFHGAASIRFDNTLAEHVKTNLCGASHLLDVIDRFQKLESVVFVSTAFSNCHLKEINEVIYETPHSPEEVIQLYRTLDANSLESLVPSMIEDRPNTYVYTKALAEQLVWKRLEGKTLAIIRPPVIGPAMQEPMPGWTDSLHGPAGLSIIAGLGIMQTVDWDYNVNTDAFPVDYIANAIIACGRDAMIKHLNERTIYNFSSSAFIPIAAGDFMAKTRDVVVKTPSIYCIRPMMVPPQKREHPLVYQAKQWYYHVMFAYIIDAILFIIGRKTLMRRVVNKMHKGCSLMKYFAIHDWKFGTQNAVTMWDSLSPYDRVHFNSDIRELTDYDMVAQTIWIGARRYLLNEPDTNISISKPKYHAIVFFYSLYQLMMAYFLIKLVLVYTPIVSLVYTVFTYAAYYSGLGDRDIDELLPSFFSTSL